ICQPANVTYTMTTTTGTLPDACTDPNHREFLPNSDDTTDTYSLPFGFEFYGIGSSDIWFSSNGVMGFRSADASAAFGNVCLGTNSGIAATIAPFWDDLVMRKGICVSESATRALITWEDAMHFGDAGTHYTFTVELRLTSGTRQGSQITIYY